VGKKGQYLYLSALCWCPDLCVERSAPNLVAAEATVSSEHGEHLDDYSQSHVLTTRAQAETASVAFFPANPSYHTHKVV
jgi:hypothetical protein